MAVKLRRHRFLACAHFFKMLIINSLLKKYLSNATDTIVDNPIIGNEQCSLISTRKDAYYKYKYPPEKTIFLTLLKNNDISFVASSSSTNYNVSETNSFNYLWKESVDFLESAKSNRRNISDLQRVHFADIHEVSACLC